MKKGYILTITEPFVQEVQVVQVMTNWVEYVTDNGDTTSHHLKAMYAETKEEANIMLSRMIAEKEQELVMAKEVLLGLI
jgi:hypothetical protein